MNEALLLLVGSLGGVVVKSLADWRTSRTTARIAADAQMPASLAAFQVALNAAAEGIVGNLQTEIDRLHKEVGELRAQHTHCLTENEVLAKRVALLEGQAAGR